MTSLRVMSYNIQGHAAMRRQDHLPKLAEVIAAVRPDVVKQTIADAFNLSAVRLAAAPIASATEKNSLSRLML